MMHRYTTFKLAISMAIVFLPLVKPDDCQPRTIIQPDNKEYLSLCGSIDGAPDVAKTDRKNPCFELKNGNLHNVRFDITSLPDAEPDKPGRIIVKDGELTHFTFSDETDEAHIFFNDGHKVLFYKSSGKKDGCYYQSMLQMPVYSISDTEIKDEIASWRARISGVPNGYKPITVCDKWYSFVL